MLIARVRHNRCVIRLASVSGKMSANAIMFATPIVKVYNILPLSKDELSEVLAFVFLGSAKPTEEDFARMPRLVRRDRVKDALKWLKLNHRDYEDLDISADEIRDLPEHGIHCGYEWEGTKNGETNNVPEAMSVDNNGEEEGTEAGPSSFAVSGLTGETYDPNVQLYPCCIRRCSRGCSHTGWVE
ncbi:hypothetical protein B0H10DRAFT_1851609 [Mycena sp. CBHHK59/15]|nr:hypothetical protein B0H10DRAFT_1851609 [Mycena sp. CBHHK59/15]